MRALYNLFFSVLLMAVLLGGSGCTLLGYWAGSGIDASSERVLILPPDTALSLLETGDVVTCRFRDGRMTTGQYGGMTMPSREQLMNLLRERDGVDRTDTGRVSVGEPLELHRRDRAPERVRFLAADAQRIWYVPSSGTDARLLLFEHITGLTRESGESLKPPFEELVKRGVFDSPSFIRLIVAGAPIAIDTSKIVDLRFQYSPVSGRMALTVLGAVVDGVALAIMTKSEKKDSPPPPTKPVKKGGEGSSQYGTGVTGCPLAESWDGTDWQREVECVPGAFFRASQRYDVARLRHIRPVDGLLRLRVRDFLEEVDSIDQLGVLCVEHSPGSVVYPTEEGRLLAVRPSAPLSAVDDRGRNVLPLLRAGDEEHWLALPAADPQRRGERRSIECRFPLPAGADSVTLLLCLRNTQWGSRLHGHFLSLFGSELQAQYDLLNSSAEARASLRRSFEEAAMLAVSVWDGAEWRSVGTVREVGHEAWRDVARRINVRGIAPGELRLRFDAPASIWMVDQVAVDAAPPSPVRVTPLSLVSAARNDGRHCESVVRAVDGDYVSLDTGEWVEAAFRVPTPPQGGRAQDLLIEFTGYYRPKMAPTSDPQPALIGRILGEPGYFARYADGLFWDSVTAMGNDK
ncbi:MAG: hypothetical protein IH600_09920 [Bacteroidetes bacterium]|nr:hypothetical protein [Bacteroidota bacterium]